MSSIKKFSVFGESVEILVSSAATNGAFMVGVQTAPPGGGPPPHSHTMEDEFLIPLEGEFEIFDGRRWSTLPREGAYLPRNQVHTFRNSGGTMGRILAVASPGGLDAYLESISPLSLPRDMEKLVQISASSGITFAGM